MSDECLQTCERRTLIAPDKFFVSIDCEQATRLSWHREEYLTAYRGVTYPIFRHPRLLQTAWSCKALQCPDSDNCHTLPTFDPTDALRQGYFRRFEAPSTRPTGRPND
jgi:hypothetical protein